MVRFTVNEACQIPNSCNVAGSITLFAFSRFEKVLGGHCVSWLDLCLA